MEDEKAEVKPEDSVVEATSEKSETVKETERIQAETEQLNKAIAEKANADARAKIAGVADAGQPAEKPAEETPAEYAKRLTGV